ncbi:hypothetical protein FH972_001437 [Carpinus fangiana]|uniref:Uncharacterized protein n=1 Tax=Carpinus fangiana TaxID=176857 RepID=A0A5N6QED6_9ROSI|nr:hypothetical protein FH972_001437 [Carpinus fangiana]
MTHPPHHRDFVGSHPAPPRGHLHHHHHRAIRSKTYGPLPHRHPRLKEGTQREDISNVGNHAKKVKKLIIQGLGTRRKEHKYELKRSLNIQLNETPESLIESIDPTHIVNHEEFENSTRYWCDPTVQGLDRSKLFRKSHMRKDGKPVTKKAESKMVRLVCQDSAAHVEEDNGDEDDIEDETNE